MMTLENLHSIRDHVKQAETLIAQAEREGLGEEEANCYSLLAIAHALTAIARSPIAQYEPD